MLPTSSEKPADLDATLVTLEKYLRRLEALSEYVSHSSLVQLVQDKFPNSLLMELEKLEDLFYVWARSGL